MPTPRTNGSPNVTTPLGLPAGTLGSVEPAAELAEAEGATEAEGAAGGAEEAEGITAAVATSDAAGDTEWAVNGRSPWWHARTAELTPVIAKQLRSHIPAWSQNRWHHDSALDFE